MLRFDGTLLRQLVEAFGKYQLVRRLGAGGMAEVFLAREPLAQGLAKILVIKKIHPSLAETPQFRQMFEDEAKVAVNLNHPNIVQTFGYGQIGPTYFLAMEHVEGVDLLRILNAAVEANARIPFGLCAYLGQQVAKALDYAHRKTDEYGEPLGIVHRDVSPQNILVSWDGMVKLVDFGIARARHVSEEEGVVKGKFAYMSPEQAAGAPVDPRTDIFADGDRAVGADLRARAVRQLEGQAGDQRHQERAGAAAARDRRVDPRGARSDHPEVPARKRPEDRYQTARDLHRALGQFFFALSSKEGKIFESGAMAALHGAGHPRGRASRRAAGAAARRRRPSPLARADPRASTPRSRRSGAATSATTISCCSRPSASSVVIVEGELSALRELRRNMGEARAREALLDFLRVTEHVAYKHQAHPDRLDDRGFTYVIGLPVGTEDDAARAIELARALIDALDGISRELSPPLALAVGAVARHGAGRRARPAPAADAPKFQYELLGQTAQIARRLATEAMPGEILVGGGIFRGARNDWSFEELDAIELPPDSDTSPGTRHERRARATRAAPARAPRSIACIGPRPRADRLADHAGLRRLVGRDLELAHARATRTAPSSSRAAPATCSCSARPASARRSIVDAFRHKLDPTTHLVLRCVGRPALRDTPVRAWSRT